jgi:hypothetical protein
VEKESIPGGCAISIKQPWAALLAAGVKTIEVRSWPTHKRCFVWIHAAKREDSRPHAREMHARYPHLESLFQLRGGVIGCGKIVACRAYRSPAEFRSDHNSHLNLVEWFREPPLYGFVFEELQTVPFFPCPGNTSFFTVRGNIMTSAPPDAPAGPAARTRP